MKISAVAALLPAAMLSGCGSPSELLNKSGAGDKGKVTAVRSAGPIAGGAKLVGTPMAQRVAVIGLLNKRNGITRDLTMKPGQALRVGAAIVRLRACEQTAPWESPQETGAFVQLDVNETRDNKWHRIFSGWLFRERPDRNVVQHPIYDVWVKSCAMSWPETGPETVKLSDVESPGKRSNASKSPDSTSGNPGTAPATAASNSAE